MAHSENFALPLPVGEFDHAIGPADARVTVVNYGDYECPDCRRRHRDIQKTIDELSSKVRLIYRHFPLVRIHPNALGAATAAEAAAAQGKFWEMHRHLYLHPNKLSAKDLRHYAREIGLDLVRFDQDIASGAYSERVLKSYHESIVLGISGVPTTFVNGVLFGMSGTELLESVRKLVPAQ
jgi:protein-disulfide isomerase